MPSISIWNRAGVGTLPTISSPPYQAPHIRPPISSPPWQTPHIKPPGSDPPYQAPYCKPPTISRPHIRPSISIWKPPTYHIRPRPTISSLLRSRALSRHATLLPHERLLKTKPHSFPFVFSVCRTNQSRITLQKWRHFSREKQHASQ